MGWIQMDGYKSSHEGFPKVSLENNNIYDTYIQIIAKNEGG